MLLLKCRKPPSPSSLLRLKKELVQHLPVFRQYHLSRGRTVAPVDINLEGPRRQMKIMTFEYVKETCKPGHGADTCRYLLMGTDGWECGKLESKEILDARVGHMTAKGDNCEGFGVKPTPKRMITMGKS